MKTHVVENESVKFQTPIQRISITDITPDIFRENYQKTGTPIILTEVGQDEPNWDLTYLTKKLADQEFFFRCYGRDRYQQDKRKWKNIGSGVNLQKMSFLDYAKKLRSHEAHEQDIYLAKCSLEATPLVETPFLTCLGEQLGLHQPASSFNMWAGPGGHVEALHYDALDGTLIQLHGSKKVVLFPPSQLYNLYPFPLSIHFLRGLKLRSWFSQVYVEKPDFEAFPKLKAALAYQQEIILKPGELLFIPAGWWHEVTALGNEMVCSVNRFWNVSPLSRKIFSWMRWRTYLAILFTLPYMAVSLAIALTHPNRKEKIRQLLHQL